MNLLRVRILPSDCPVGIPRAFLSDHLPLFKALDDTRAILQNLTAQHDLYNLKESWGSQLDEF